MNQIVARKAWVAGGWADGVRMTFAKGRIATIETGVEPGSADDVLDCVIPGIANGHSHAFQRALAGRTERRSDAGKDDFWSWRTQMYALSARIDAAQMKDIATQLYLEMLEAGYTAVAEFHYFHDNGSKMAEALIHAAETTGIRLTLVPVLYERAGFDAPDPLPEQSRFAMSCDAFLAMHESLLARAGAATKIGIGVHSLRAVGNKSLQAVAARANANESVMHIHIAEQTGEVEQCLDATGYRPVRWLFDNVDVDERWCLVHATHLAESEIKLIAGSGAVVCLCPSTEGNLGDGLFPLAAYRQAGGAIAIGSDSQVTVDPFEELRWLEYGQRLNTLSRNVGAGEGEQVGTDLYAAVLAGGRQATGEPGDLVVGAPADLVSLDVNAAILAGHDDATRLNALVFSGHRSPIDSVMVAGEWRVSGGMHLDREDIARNYRRTVSALS